MIKYFLQQTICMSLYFMFALFIVFAYSALWIVGEWPFKGEA